HLRGMHEVRGGVAAFGYCFGGMLAFQVTAKGQPDAAVIYYASGCQDLLDLAPEIHCPTLYEFGSVDQFLPADIADRMRDATAGAEGVQVIVHEGANHAFDNDRFSMHHPEAAAAAWEEVQRFLSRWLPAGR
ncbi:MAG: dienelactone hydrolase family protein, partial [Candidatus Dormiibacterota bacterium]